MHNFSSKFNGGGPQTLPPRESTSVTPCRATPPPLSNPGSASVPSIKSSRPFLNQSRGMWGGGGLGLTPTFEILRKPLSQSSVIWLSVARVSCSAPYTSHHSNR